MNLLASLLFGFLYGIMENRLFFEANLDEWILKHFRTYHLYMLTIFVLACRDANAVLWTGNVLLSLLVQNVTWWFIQWHWFGWKPRPDVWDNWGGLPLVFNVFWWWWAFGIMGIVLQIVGGMIV